MILQTHAPAMRRIIHNAYRSCEAPTIEFRQVDRLIRIGVKIIHEAISRRQIRVDTRIVIIKSNQLVIAGKPHCLRQITQTCARFYPPLGSRLKNQRNRQCDLLPKQVKIYFANGCVIRASAALRIISCLPSEIIRWRINHQSICAILQTGSQMQPPAPERKFGNNAAKSTIGGGQIVRCDTTFQPPPEQSAVICRIRCGLQPHFRKR